MFGALPSLWPNQAFRQGGQTSPREKVLPFLHASPNQWDKLHAADPQPGIQINAAVNFNMIAGFNQESAEVEEIIPATVNQTDIVQQVIPDLDQLMINSAAYSLAPDQMPKFDSLLNASPTSETATSSRTDVSETRFSVTSSESNLEHITTSSSTMEDIQPRSRPCSVTAQKEIPFFGRN